MTATVKPPVAVAHAQRQQVLAMRRSHSLKDIAIKTGVPVGTVKSWCNRAGLSRDNEALRQMMTLPPIQQSTSTALAVPELPPQQEVTGDQELDAVLWLRQVIKTGQQGLIEKAMEASKLIQTPLKALEDRYLKHLVAKNPGNWTVAFATFGFADLEGLAKSSVQKLARQHEALARFGTVDALFANTPAETFATDVLKGCKRDKTLGIGWYDDAAADKRFNSRTDLLPHTLSDCLHELAYWHELYRLRSVHDGVDQTNEAYAREQFAFRCLGRIKPRNKAEAIAAFRYLAEHDKMDDSETEGILLNLIGGTA